MPVIDINIEKIDIVASWNFTGDSIDELNPHNCKICRRALVAPSLQEIQLNKSNSVVIEGRLSKGICGHIFHEDCINRSVKSGGGSCPNCNVRWQTAKNIKSNALAGNIEQLMLKRKTAIASKHKK
jgi:hypothetical protein